MHVTVTVVTDRMVSILCSRRNDGLTSCTCPDAYDVGMTKTVHFYWRGHDWRGPDAALRNLLAGFRPIAAAWDQETEAASPKLRRAAHPTAAQRLG